ncbi:outer membrane beta-barrel protein [Flavitalea antarctica]
MQHLKDDMDELFRKAADEYPLNTGTPDWNKVAQGLAQEQVPEPPVKKTYRRYTWLLILLPLGFLLMETVKPGALRRLVSLNSAEINTEALRNPVPAVDDRNSNEKENAAKKTIDATKDNATGDAKIVEGVNTNDNGVATNEGVVRDKLDASAEANAIKEGNDIEDGNDTEGGDLPKELSDNREANANKKGNKSGKAPGERNIAAQGQSQQGTTGSLPGNLPAAPGTKGGGATAFATSKQINEPGITDPSAAGNDAGTVSALISPYTKLGLAASTNSPDPSQIAMPQLTKLEPGPIKKQKIKTKNFYVGTIGGLDLTTVSFQKTSDIGYHFGGLAGYTFSRKWSVEVGFIVEKKSYYTDGKYFDKSGLRLGPNTTVVSVDGDCKMFEIPFSVKYDITNTYKSNFFVTGGFSSYIMKKEEYEMVYQYGSGSRGTHYYPYKNSSKNFFAELRLTGGYALKLPQHFSLRIEPYLNIPVTGVGYGKLHLMSAGLNAGIFKRIF